MELRQGDALSKRWSQKLTIWRIDEVDKFFATFVAKCVIIKEDLLVKRLKLSEHRTQKSYCYHISLEISKLDIAKFHEKFLEWFFWNLISSNFQKLIPKTDFNSQLHVNLVFIWWKKSEKIISLWSIFAEIWSFQKIIPNSFDRTFRDFLTESFKNGDRNSATPLATGRVARPLWTELQ